MLNKFPLYKNKTPSLTEIQLPQRGEDGMADPREG